MPQLSRAVSYIEKVLAFHLRQRLVGGDTAKSILEDGGLLESLQAKAKVAYCIGLISAGCKHNIDVLASVRNRFAHEIGPVSFSDSVVVEQCNKLTAPRAYGVTVDCQEGTSKPLDYDSRFNEFPPRHRFAMTAAKVAMDLWGNCLNTERIERRTDKWDR